MADYSPAVRELYYKEIYGGKSKGIFVLTIQGARFYGVRYLPEEDGEKIEFEIIDDDL